MSNPYVITEQAINELRERSTEKLKKLFPQGVPQEILKRINREESALRTNPNIYSLLIVDDVIKTLRRHKFSATVDGDWFSSYHAWLLDLTEYNPIDIQLCYRDMGLCAKQFIRDDCVSSPIEIYLSPEYGKSMCVDLTRMYAHKYDFWVSEYPGQTDSFMLINECYRADDIYANYAPIIKIVDRK
ncbi:MAG: hypothetical protein IJ300_00110 [Clostridia bacterium]|nr:hypothetical protein [Clostridia bacterium]